MDQMSLVERIQQELDRQSGIQAIVAEAGGVIILSGTVASASQREHAQQIVTSLASGKPVENNLDIETLLPEGIKGASAAARADPELADARNVPESAAGVEQSGDLNPEFTGQPLETNEINVVDDTVFDADPNVEPEPTYFPPTDPVITENRRGDVRVLGGWAPTSDSTSAVAASAEDNLPGDEALATAIQLKLHEDAATTDLHIEVEVENGVAHLRGHVPLLEDAQNAEAVAADVPGVREVDEEFEVDVE